MRKASEGKKVFLFDDVMDDKYLCFKHTFWKFKFDFD